MLTINELGYTLDSLQNLKTEIVSYSENINLRTGITNNNIIQKTDLEKKKTLPADILSVYTNKQKLEILKIANSTVSTGYSIDATQS
jgi:lipopolysaccharide export system permease protein